MLVYLKLRVWDGGEGGVGELRRGVNGGCKSHRVL